MFGFLAAPCRQCGPRTAASQYRSYFCGVSNRLRREYGLPFRALVNRDATFLALLCGALLKDEGEPVLERCCNPLGRYRPTHSHATATDFAAAATVCALETKLRDDLDDERGWRRGAARVLLPTLKRSGANARATLERLGFPWRRLDQTLAQQTELEKALDQSPRGLDPAHRLAAASEPTALAIEQLVGFCAELTGTRDNITHAKRLGRALGRLIYWADARDDRERDRARLKWNPLLLPGPLEAPWQEPLLAAVTHETTAAWDATQGLQFHRHQPMIHQIINRSLIRNLNKSSYPAPGDEDEEERKRCQAQEDGKRTHERLVREAAEARKQALALEPDTEEDEHRYEDSGWYQCCDCVECCCECDAGVCDEFGKCFSGCDDACGNCGGDCCCDAGCCCPCD